MIKKILRYSLIFAFTVLLFTNGVSAQTNDGEIVDIYQKAINFDLIQLDKKNNKVKVVDNVKYLKGFDNEDYIELSEVVDSINYLIENEYGYLNKELEFNLLTPDEITEVVFREQSDNQNLIDLSTQLSLYFVDPGFPSLALNSLVTGNRNELERFYWNVQKVSPKSAYTSTVGFFVGKVRENGSWDYKVKAGFKPWYKKFYATMFDGSRQVITSEFIGNYNYGFTGEFLFSKNTLLIGGQAVGGNVFKPESAEDRRPIILGYDHAVRYR